MAKTNSNLFLVNRNLKIGPLSRVFFLSLKDMSFLRRKKQYFANDFRVIFVFSNQNYPVDQKQASLISWPNNHG